MSERIYLDHHATTPLLPEAREAMLPLLGEVFGNASSVHREGRAAARAVSEAREQVAALVGEKASRVIFTSSGTEANNLAIMGAAHHRRKAEGRSHVVTVATEHESVIAPMHRLQGAGFDVTVIAVDRDGRWSPEAVLEACTENTALISAAIVNYELGNRGPVEALSERAHELGIWLHCDAAIGPGWLPLERLSTHADLIALSAHKFGGPKGAGAVVFGKKCRLDPLFVGGYQERGRRPGVHNVAGLAGMGVAASIAAQRTMQQRQRVAAMRDDLAKALFGLGRPVVVNGQPDLPSCLNVSFPGLEGEALLLSLDMAGLAVSSGAACTSGTIEPSGPITALGAGAEVEQSSIRISLGFDTEKEQTERAAAIIERVVRRLDSLTLS